VSYINNINGKVLKDRRRYCNWKEEAVGSDPVAKRDL
jgi:hypothetical protein